MKSASYQEIRNEMKGGDLLAFSGSGFISRMIKDVTRSNVSHVGVILQSHIPTMDGFINQIIESVGKHKGRSGVIINRLSDHVDEYSGLMWWLPLSKEARAKFDQGVFFSYMLKQVGKKYDLPGAISAGLDFIPDNREDLDKLYCSELAAAGYEKTKLVEEINCSEMTPIDVCRFHIFGDVVQIKGQLSELA